MALHSRPGLGAKVYYFWPIKIITPTWWDNAANGLPRNASLHTHTLHRIAAWAGRRGLTRSNTHLCDEA